MKKVILLVGLGVLLGAAITQVRAQVNQRMNLGGHYSHDLTAFYQMQVHITPAGKLRAPRKFEEQREHYRVPDFYGTLIDVTSNDDKVIFWYQDSEGLVRNAIFDQTDKRLMEIERAEVEQLRFEVARP